VSLSVAFRAPNWLGDSVMATVVPAALRRSPEVGRVAVLAARGLGDVFACAPDVDETVEIAPGGEVDALRTGGYDLVLLGPTSFGSAWRAYRAGVRAAGFATAGRGFLLARSLPGGEDRRGRHQVENYRALAGLVGAPEPDDEPAVRVDPAWLRSARERWPADGRRRVALQPGATFGPAKRWAAAKFADVARALAKEGHDVAVLGGPQDAEPVAETIAAAGGAARDLSGRFRLGELAALLESADLLITNDTGPMHLAAAVGTRCLAVFGSTSPEWTAPRGRGHRVVRNPVPCAPCFQRRCRIGTPCLEGIAAERVAHGASRMLAETPEEAR
jgi:heptosyltransferase-2